MSMEHTDRHIARRRSVGWSLVACAVVALLAAGCGGSASAGTAGSTKPSAYQVKDVPIDSSPLQAGLGGVWSASSFGLIYLQGQSARAQTISLPNIIDVALNSTRVYALSDEARKVYAVDPSTRRVVRTWHLSDTPNALTATDSHLYVGFPGTPTKVEAIDLQTATSITRAVPGISDSGGQRTIAYGADTLWVTDGARLVRLDPSTLAVRSSTRLIAEPDLCHAVIWFGDGSLWAACSEADVGIYRVSAQTGRVVARRTDRGAIQIGFSPHSVWVTSIIGPTALDPKTARIQWTEPTLQVPGRDSAGIAVSGGKVWVAYQVEYKLQRFPESLAR